MQRIRVDLPEPEGPQITIRSAVATARSIARRTCWAPNQALTPRSSTAGGRAGASGGSAVSGKAMGARQWRFRPRAQAAPSRAPLARASIRPGQRDGVALDQREADPGRPQGGDGGLAGAGGGAVRVLLE